VGDQYDVQVSPSSLFLLMASSDVDAGDYPYGYSE